MKKLYNFKLDRELAVFINNFLCTVGKRSGNFSTFGGNDVGMFSTLIES